MPSRRALLLTSVDITGKWSWPVRAVVISKKLLTKLVTGRHEGSRVGVILVRSKNMLDDRSKWSWSSTSKHCTHRSRSCPCMHARTEQRSTAHNDTSQEVRSRLLHQPLLCTSLRVDWPSFTCWIPQWLRWSTSCMTHSPGGPASTTPTNKNLAF